MEQTFITELTNNDISILVKDNDIYALIKNEHPKHDIDIDNVCATVHWKSVIEFGKSGISNIYPIIERINLRIAYTEHDANGEELSTDNEIEADNIITLIPNIETSDMQPSQHGFYIDNIKIYKNKVCIY